MTMTTGRTTATTDGLGNPFSGPAEGAALFDAADAALLQFEPAAVSLAEQLQAAQREAVEDADEVGVQPAHDVIAGRGQSSSAATTLAGAPSTSSTSRRK